MNIAILGAGFSGLALTWNIVSSPFFKNAKVTVFDKHGVGGGASSVSAGLLHPFGGPKAKKNWRGDEGVEETLKLLQVASDALGEPVYRKSGLIRLATNPDQHEAFIESAHKNEGVSWIEKEQCQTILKGLAAKPGIFIENAYSVISSKYLEGLFLACCNRGASLSIQELKSLKEVEGYDLVIVALGADILDIEELQKLPIRRLKGHVLEFSWPSELPPPDVAVTSDIYLVMNLAKTSCIAGATFEREFTSREPDPTFAAEYILKRLYKTFPSLKEVEPCEYRAGIRATTADHRPLISQINDKCWVMTGLGSKGLLYHALFSKELIDRLAR